MRSDGLGNTLPKHLLMASAGPKVLVVVRRVPQQVQLKDKSKLLDLLLSVSA